jgi:hypothetical protein
MTTDRRLPFSIPLLILDGVGMLLLVAGLATHFAGMALLPEVLRPWALYVAGFGFLLHIPFTLDMLRRGMARRQAAQGADAAAPRPQAPAVRRR